MDDPRCRSAARVAGDVDALDGGRASGQWAGFRHARGRRGHAVASPWRHAPQRADVASADDEVRADLRAAYPARYPSRLESVLKVKFVP